MSKKLSLITEYVEPTQMKMTTEGGNVYIEGIFGSAELENKNGRKYKRETLEREVNQLRESIDKRCLWGELNHPTTPDINLERAAILIEKLEWKGTDLVGRAKVLKTPMGRIAETLIKEGAVGISSRGLGTVDDNGYVNNESYKLLTFDLVSNPSNHPSWVKGVYEGASFGEIADDKSVAADKAEASKTYVKYIKDELKKMFKV